LTEFCYKWPDMKKFILLISFFGILFTPAASFAHCDTENGPVIIAAKKALKTNNVNLVLIWVQEKDEGIIREAFQKTVDLRKISPAVQQTLDKYFFETLVRIHRAGEGAPYTGLKDSAAVEVPIAAADKGLQNNTDDGVIKLLEAVITKGVNDRFKDAISRKNYAVNDIEDGRQYVAAYVTFMHYVEAIYNAAEQSGSGHHEHEMMEKTQVDKDHAVSPIIQNSPKNNNRTDMLIAGGILLIILVQILLSKNNTFKIIYHGSNNPLFTKSRA
jgi:hypothetical protein